MSCQKHPTYKGLRLTKRAKTCQGCIDFYNENKDKGVKETRTKKKVKEKKIFENNLNYGENEYTKKLLDNFNNFLKKTDDKFPVKINGEFINTDSFF